MGKVTPKKLPKMIALDSKKQSTLTKAVRKIGKSMKAEKLEQEEKNNRGIILVSHLPYGFFEEGVKGFFSQFGHIRRIRVARSKKTGRAKGYAFIEFEYPEVAKIAAESMNNYLMYERIIKCRVLDEDNLDAKKMFAARYVKKNSYPTLHRRRKIIKELAAPMEEEALQKEVDARAKCIARNNKKLEAFGINYKYEDVPESVLNQTRVDEESEATTPSARKVTANLSLELNVKVNNSTGNFDLISGHAHVIPNTPKKRQSLEISEKPVRDPTSKKSPKMRRSMEVATIEEDQMIRDPAPKKSPKVRRSMEVATIQEDEAKDPLPKKSPKARRSMEIGNVEEDQIKNPTPRKSPKIRRSMEVGTIQEDEVRDPTPKKSPKMRRTMEVANIEDEEVQVKNPTPRKSPKVRRSMEVGTIQENEVRDPTPKKSPKMRRSSEGKHNEETVAEIKPDSAKKKPKFSPKLLRSRARSSIAPTQAQSEVNEAKQPIADLKSKFSPKVLRSQARKSTAARQMETPVVDKKPKFSPKLLRSRARQSEAPAPSGTAKTPTQKTARRKSMK